MMTIRSYVAAATAVLLALSLGACSKSSNVTVQNASTAAPASGGTVLVKAGTVYDGTLQQEISSKKSHNGDTFTLKPRGSFVYNIPSLNGAVVEGHVDNVTPAGIGKKPGMTIVFEDLLMPDGSKVPISVQLVSAGAFDAKSHHMRTIGMMVGGAIAGKMAAGAMGHHGGGMLGAAGGYLASQQIKTDIDVKPGTTIRIKFLSDATTGSQPTDAAAPSSSP